MRFLEVECNQVEFIAGINELHTYNFKDMLIEERYSVDTSGPAPVIVYAKYPFLG